MVNVLVPTPIEQIEVTLGIRGEYDDITAVPVANQIAKIIRNMKGLFTPEGVTSDITSDVLYVKFGLIGSKKVDVAYRLEQMVSNYILNTFYALPSNFIIYFRLYNKDCQAL